MQLRHAEGVLAVEERGLVLVMSALRVAYAGGGDGEMALRADARNLAAFVRDPAAAVTAALLPFSLSAKYDTQVGLSPGDTMSPWKQKQHEYGRAEPNLVG